jgi:hypothetical protein
MNTTDRLISGLFETRALRVCPKDKPFWYTSGTIGPYYVNTHFLYGSEEKAVGLLELIDRVKDDHYSCPETVLEQVRLNYLTDEIFSDVIDLMYEYIKKEIGTGNFEYISGGERRDWFFSLMLAEKLGKPHVTIFKDLSCITTEKGKTEPSKPLCGAWKSNRCGTVNWRMLGFGFCISSGYMCLTRVMGSCMLDCPEQSQTSPT